MIRAKILWDKSRIFPLDFLFLKIMNSNDLVKNILQRDVDEQDRLLKSTEVIKPAPVDIDLGNLLLWDPNIIDQQAYKYNRFSIIVSIQFCSCSFREDRDEYIKNTMRDNMQLLVNALWQVSEG